MKYVLSIAGSDSSGGAGLQADLKTFTNHQTYGTTVVTVLTAQNPKAISAIAEIDPSFVEEQIDSIFKFHIPDAIKIGVVWSKENVIRIAKILKKHKATNVVLDPVMISTSKSKLMADGVVKAMIKYLFPIATVITPNYYEAEILSGIKITKPTDAIKAAKGIASFFGGCILIKGGHNKQNANDYFYSKTESFWLYAPKITKIDAHGTGCTLSSAIAANLAHGDNVTIAIRKAKAYVYNSIYHNINGLLNHNKGFINKLPLFYRLINANAKKWHQYINHDFVTKISNDSLNYQKFIYYLIQDYLYLKEFNKAFINLSKKAKTQEEKKFCEQQLDFIVNNELELHKFFIDEKVKLEEQKTSKVCNDYIKFLKDNNSKWDFLDLLVGLSVCYIGYAFLGQNIKEVYLKENKYAKWINEYIDPKFWQLSNGYIDFVNRYSDIVGENKMRKLNTIFNQACILEIKFFNQATI